MQNADDLSISRRPAGTEEGLKIMTDAKIELARLYENKSKAGKPYFVGYLGKAKLLMLKDERAAEGQPPWVLFLAERPEKRADAGQQASAPSGYRSRRYGEPRAKQTGDGAPFDDALPPWMSA